MNTYHKIQTIFKREPKGNRSLIMDQYSCPEFEYLKDNIWTFTEKLDGTNIRIIFLPAESRPEELPDNVTVSLLPSKMLFKGKTDRAVFYPPLLKNLESIFTPKIDLFINQFEHPVCLYGEGVGPKIQKGGDRYTTEQNPAQHFVLFDVKVGDANGRSWWLKREGVEEIAKLLDIEVVPVIGYGTLSDMVLLCQNGFGSQWGDFRAEGIVARPEVDLLCRSGQRIITKLKYKDFEH